MRTLQSAWWESVAQGAAAPARRPRFPIALLQPADRRVSPPAPRRTLGCDLREVHARERDGDKREASVSGTLGVTCNATRVTRQCRALPRSRYSPRMRIGYGRVSTRDQHPEAQHDAPQVRGVDGEGVVDAGGGRGGAGALLVVERQLGACRRFVPQAARGGAP